MHCLSSVYWVTILLHVSGLPVAYYQEVIIYIYIYIRQLVQVVCLSQQSAGLTSIPSRAAYIRLRRTTRTNCHMYTLLPPDDGQLASPKHVEGKWLSKVKINNASSWFHYGHTRLLHFFSLWRCRLRAVRRTQQMPEERNKWHSNQML
jgi:hypothetical protein